MSILNPLYLKAWSNMSKFVRFICNIKFMKRTILTILTLCVSAIAALAQISVTGVVLDENQQPLPGAAVLLDGSASHGTVTDENGQYKIVVPSAESVLRYEFMGYSSVKMMVGNFCKAFFKSLFFKFFVFIRDCF